MIRPSSLSIARYCMLAPALSDLYPSRSEGTDRGQNVDGQVTAEHNDGVVATDPDARACLAWLRAHLSEKGTTRLQQKVRLMDPDTGGLLTEGTLDVEHDDGEGRLTIVDLKKREQWLAGRLSPPDENLQLHAYALARALEGGFQRYQLCLLMFGDGQVEAVWSERQYTVETWTPILEEIRDIQARQVPNPKPTQGPHCVACWGRLHCPSWTLPAHDGGSELVALTRPGGLTADNVGKAIVATLALKDVAKKAQDVLEEWVKQHGPIVVGNRQWGPVQMPGRVTVDTDHLEKDGLLEKYSRRGGAYVQHRWTKAK